MSDTDQDNDTDRKSTQHTIGRTALTSSKMKIVNETKKRKLETEVPSAKAEQRIRSHGSDEHDTEHFSTEELSRMSRSERKRHREKKRRSDVNKGFDDLMSLLIEIDPDVRAEAELQHDVRVARADDDRDEHRDDHRPEGELDGARGAGEHDGGGTHGLGGAAHAPTVTRAPGATSGVSLRPA